MMRKILILTIILFSYTGLCYADELGAAFISGVITGFSYPDPPNQTIYVNWIGFRPPNPFPDETVCSFRDVLMTSQDYDTTLIILPTNGCFPGAVDFLTDNVSNYVGAEVHIVGPGSRHSASSVTAQEQVVFGLATPDFHGAAISSISLRVTEFFFVERPDQSYSHDLHITVSMIIEGTWGTPIESTSWGIIKNMYQNEPNPPN